MKRREFITLVGGAAATWPLAARAQQTMPVVGFLRSTSAANSAHLVNAFRKGLNKAGFVEGQNVTIEYRWADDHNDRVPALAADLIRRPAAVIVANGIAAQVAKAATATTPIVAVSGSDPVRIGLVASLNRPGGNVTGVVFTATDLTAKRLGQLHELVPKTAVTAVLLDPNYPEMELVEKDAQETGRAIGRPVLSSKPQESASSIPPSRLSRRRAPARCWSAAVHFSTTSVANSSRSPPASRCPRAM